MSDEPEKTAGESPEEAPAVEPETPSSTDSSQRASSEEAPTAAEAQVDDESTTPAAGDELAGAVDDAAQPAAESDEAEPAGSDEPAANTPAPKKPASRTKAPAKATPTRRRDRAQREPGEPLPVVRAQAKYVRSSARKARLVCDHIRGKSVVEARAILAVTPRAIARDWSKLLESAVANAEHNHELVGEDLYVKAVHADEGPTIKRFRPRAMGRATPIRKRTSHLTILLTPKD